MDKVIDKIIGARYLIAIIAAFVFAFKSCNGTLSKEFTERMLETIIIAYFVKGSNNGNSKS